MVAMVPPPAAALDDDDDDTLIGARAPPVGEDVCCSIKL
jgi:hypothetical protein